MNKTRPEDTTLVLILRDGTHRVTMWRGESVNFTQVRKAMAETVRHLDAKQNEVVWGFLAGGQSHQQYTGSEVHELAQI